MDQQSDASGDRGSRVPDLADEARDFADKFVATDTTPGKSLDPSAVSFMIVRIQ